MTHPNAGSRCPPTPGIFFGACRCLVLCCVICGAADRSFGAPEALPEIEEVLQPLGVFSAGKEGERLPMKLEAYRDLVARARAALGDLPGTPLLQAEYRATFVDHALRDGHFTIGVHRWRKESQIVRLEPLNLALAHVGWRDGPAVWGRAPNGKTELLIDRENGELVGDWSLRGERLTRGVNFEFEVVRAAISRIQLRIPADQTLSCVGTEAPASVPAPEAGWRIWTINLGSRSRCQITIAPTNADAHPEPLTLVHQDLVYTVRQEDLRIQADYNLEVLQAPIRELEIRVDPEIDIHSASYGDVSLPFQETSGDRNGRRLTIDLPDPLIGQGRLLRLRGIARVRLDQDWTLPALRVSNAVFADGRSSVRTQAPLELKSFRLHGYRQTGIEEGGADDDTVTFRQLVDSGTIRVLIGNPAFKATARSFSELQTGKEHWSAVSWMDWTASAGTAFDLRCKIPADWEITNVRVWEIANVRSQEKSRTSDVTGWEPETQPDLSRQLVIHLLESLNPERPKRIEVFARRTPVPADQETAIPAFQPLEVDGVDMLISIAADPALRPVLEPGTTFDVVRPEDLPREWKDADFWKELSSRVTPGRLLLRSTDAQADGDFYLQSLQTPVDVDTIVQADLTDDRLAEKVTLRMTPQHGRVERFLVYVSEAGPTLNWALADRAESALDAGKWEVARHAAWGLPPVGELWEVRLPAPRTSPFTVIGSRTRGLRRQGRISLVFVPQANAAKGRVEVHVPSKEQFHLQPRLLTRGPSEAQSKGREADGLQSPETSLTWLYQSTAASLEYVVSEDAGPVVTPTIGRLHLKSQILFGESSDDLHRAIYEVIDALPDTEFRWELPQSATVLEAKLDGQRDSVLREGSNYRLPRMGRSGRHSIEILYRDHAESGSRLRPHRIVVPQVISIPIVDFDWDFGLPPGIELAAEPAGLVLRGMPTRLSWTERLFGPLGRDAQTSRFDPFSSETWVRTDEEHTRVGNRQASVSLDGNRDQLELPAVGADWRSCSASGPRVPRLLQLELWDARGAHLWGWLALLTCATIGATLRTWRFRCNSVWCAIWLGACALLAVNLWPLGAQIFGGCLVGSLLVCLIPQTALIRPSVESGPSPAPPVPGGSTQSIQLRVIGFLLVGAVGARIGWGQDRTAPSQAQRPANARFGEKAPGDGPFRVLIPTDQEGRPAGAIPLAYVPLQLIDRLEKIASTGSNAPEYLIAASDYQAQLGADGAMIMHARFDVHVLSAAPVVAVELPLTNVNLGGADACMVNGRPHPIVGDPNRNGLMIYLPGLGAERAESVPPSGVSGPSRTDRNRGADASAGNRTENSSGVGSADDARVKSAVYRVQLQVYPVINRNPAGGNFAIGIPPVADSRFELKWDDPELRVEFPATRGDIEFDPERRQAAVLLGDVSQLRTTWSTMPSAVEPPESAEISAACVVDAQPSLLQFHYRIHCRVKSKVSSLVLRLPAGIAVRSVGPAPLSYAVEAASGKESRIHIDFLRPQTRDFAISIEFVMPNDSERNSFGIPPMPLVGARDDATDVRLTLHQLAVRTSSEFQLELASDPGNSVTQISPEAFLANWDGKVDDKPQLAFKILDPSPLRFRLQPLTPSRVVRTTVVGDIRSRRLDWTMTATIDVQSAAAFQHQLRVDPRLTINSVSVKEDDVNRLLNWSPANDRVTLFLRDKTTGTQTVTLQGTLPLQVPQELELPQIQFLDATTADAKMLLYQDPELAVELVDADRLERVEPRAEQKKGTAHGLLVGWFKIPTDQPPISIRISQNVPQLDVDAVTVVEAREARWQVTTNLHYRVRQGHGSDFKIRIPPEMSQCEISPSDIAPLQNKEEDGSLIVSLIPSQPVRDRFVVSVTASMNIPPDVPWTLPEIVPLNATLGQSFFVVAPSDALTVAEPRISGLRPAPLTAEFEKQLPLILNPNRSASYQGISRPWQVMLNRKSTAPRDEGILLAESRIWLDRDGSLTGETTLTMPPSDLEGVEVEMPPESRIDAVLVDGHSSAAKQPDANRLNIPLATPQTGQIVTIQWAQAPAGAQRLIGRTALRIPQPRRIHVERSIVSVVPPSGYSLGSSSGLRPLSRQAAVQEYLDAFGRLIRAQADAGQLAQDPAWSRLAREVSRARDALAIGTGRSDLSAEQIRGLENLRSQVRAVRELPSSPQPAAGAPIQAKPFATIVPDFFLSIDASGLFGETDSEDPHVAVWYWNDALRTGVVSTIVGLIGLFAVVRLLRVPALGRWARIPALTWTIAAVVWWLWLAPSWLGLVLFLAAGASLLQRRSGRHTAGSGPGSLDFVLQPHAE